MSPFPGQAPTDPLSGKIMKISVIVLKTSRGFPNGKGLILGKTNYLGELFKNCLRGALGHFLSDLRGSREPFKNYLGGGPRELK